MLPRCAVLIVDGYDRHGRWGEFNRADALRYPWIELCLQQIAAHSDMDDCTILVYDNAWMPSHRQAMRRIPAVRILPRRGARIERGHAAALDHLVRQVEPSVEYVITMDSDAFPIADGWVELLVDAMRAGYAVAGIYRDEMAPRIRPYVHPSCLCARREDLLTYGVSFRKRDGEDIGQRLFDMLCRDRPFLPLRRSNVHNAHPIMGGIYGDIVYHHGAGSRRPSFWNHATTGETFAVAALLRDAAFTDLAALVAELRGERAPLLTGDGHR